MTFAAAQNGGVRSLAVLVLLVWSAAATAQPAVPAQPATPESPPKPVATAPAKPPAAKDKTPAAAKPQPAPAAAVAAKPAGPTPPTQKPAKQAASAPTQTVPPPATSKPGSVSPPDAAPSASPPAGPSSGESWVKVPGGQTPSSPWPEGAAADANAPPPVYYVEQAPNPSAGAATPPPPNDTAEPPMRLQIEEPPPPPVPRHLAPRTAFWLGARVGYFIPFGDLWGRCSSSGYSACDQIDGTKFSSVAATGPMFELDVGARLGRNYVVYFGWERAQLGGASGPSPDPASGSQLRAESDYFAVGVRLSSDPDDIGLLLDLSIGARRFRGLYENDVELQLTDAPMESRLGIGVDIRTHRRFTLSPMLTLGLGSFGKAEWVTSTTTETAVPSDADRLTHGWATLQLGGHFDIAGGR